TTWKSRFLRWRGTISMVTITTLDINTLLVETGVDKEKAKPLAKDILSRDEAAKTLATKEDISDLKDQLRSIPHSASSAIAEFFRRREWQESGLRPQKLEGAVKGRYGPFLDDAPNLHTGNRTTLHRDLHP
ncbi:MAG: hypothetical protein ACU0DK_09075, partial [Pseudooceanicola sp.]